MATLALAAGGALLGGAGFGSMGASIGWALGGVAGSLLFPPKGQDTVGPRLNDLSVQTSEYGTGIPVVFGTVRIAGNIIWAPPLREQTNRRRVGGKGAPRATATTYSYFGSWAVGLCEGPAQAVRRIWFDDKLVFDSSGASLQIEVPGLVWRFYPGSETQLPDPLIEASVGADNAVAHRGLCYVVFDDVPLERLNNRIPNVTCEVVMSGSLSVQDDAITGRTGNFDGAAAAVDWESRRVWTVNSGTADDRIWETQLGTLASRAAISIEALPGGPAALAAVPGVGLFYHSSLSNSMPVYRFDPDTGALTGTFGSSNSGLTNTTTSVTSSMTGVQASVPLQVRGAAGARSFLLMSPSLEWAGGGYCIDADSLTYVWGSTVSGHPRLFVPGARGAWVQGEQRDGETDAFYLAGRSGFVEVWRVTVTSAAAGITSGSGIGGTLGVTAARLPDLTAAVLGHGAGTIGVRQASFDLEDAAMVLITAVGSTHRMAKVTAAGTVLWSVAGPVTQNTVGHASRLDAGLLSVLGTNQVVTHSTRDGLVVATQAVAAAAFTSGWQLFEASTRALHAQTTAGGARRFLVLRQGSSSVPLSSVVQALCARAGLEAADVNTAALTDAVAGYVVAKQAPIRSAIEPLGACYSFDAVESDDVLRFVVRGGAAAATVAHAELVRAGDRAIIAETRAQDVELPRQLTVRYLNPERDYEPASQHWQRPLAPSPTMRSRNVETIDLPLVLTGDAAKGLARRMLTAAWRERTRFEFTGTAQHLRLEPTDPIALVLADGTTQRARIISAQLGADWTLRFEAVAEAAADYALTAAADSGQSFSSATVPAPYGIRALLPNLPLLRDGDDLAGTGLRAYALAGTYPGQTWRSSIVWRGGLASLDLLGALTASMTWGAVVGGVAVPASYWTWDDATTITLVPQHGGAEIVSATDLEVLNGANLGALISPDGVVEIIQHATAALNGDGSITLSRLLRGRRGTEDAGAMAAGVYVLLDGADLRLTSPLGALNQSETFRVQGAFQQVQEAPSVSRVLTGRAERPFAPVHIAGARDGSNNLTITWVRRTRLGGEWLDGSGTVPLAEASEAYEVEIRNAGDTATLRTITGLATPTASYTAAQQTADGLTPGNPVVVRVFQISATVGRGIAGRATI